MGRLAQRLAIGDWGRLLRHSAQRWKEPWCKQGAGRRRWRVGALEERSGELDVLGM
jgi:hypothetical protein